MHHPSRSLSLSRSLARSFKPRRRHRRGPLARSLVPAARPAPRRAAPRRARERQGAEGRRNRKAIATAIESRTRVHALASADERVRDRSTPRVENRVNQRLTFLSLSRETPSFDAMKRRSDASSPPRRAS